MGLSKAFEYNLFTWAPKTQAPKWSDLHLVFLLSTHKLHQENVDHVSTSVIIE